MFIRDGTYIQIYEERFNYTLSVLSGRIQMLYVLEVFEPACFLVLYFEMMYLIPVITRIPFHQR